MPKSAQFTKNVLTWFDQHGRKDLPWQQQRTGYRVWISEIMLQQTQVAKVIPYFLNFIDTFPLINQLADASLDDVLALWSGLGYYSRARNIHKTAQIIQYDMKGQFPQSIDLLQTLPGIGRSTAGAILSLGLKQAATILDGNIKRILARQEMVAGDKNSSATLKQLWHYASHYTPSLRHRDYNQAMMDLGALICKKSSPLCESCPIQASCKAYQTQTQNDYPVSKKKSKTRRTQAKYMLLIYNQNQQVLLMRRPDYGLWGGLWILPMVDQLDDIPACLNPLTCTYQQSIHTSFVHKFSHFDLTITPVIIQLAKHRSTWQLNAEQRQHWHHHSQNLPGGTATPILNLLKQFQPTDDKIND